MALSDIDEDNDTPEFYNVDDENAATFSTAGKKPAAAGEEQEDDDDFGDVNLEELDSKVWLVKIPKFLAEKWNQPRKEGSPIGKLRIYNQSDDRPSSIAILLNDSEENKDVPKRYKMQVTNQQVRNMFIFSEGRDPREVLKPTSERSKKAVPMSMTGRVHHECMVTPEYTPEYEQIMKKRYLDNHQNSRRIQAENVSAFNRSMGINANRGGFDTAKKRIKTFDDRMERMDRKDLMEMLFACFEKYPYWPLKGLVEHTKQPTAFLKEVLTEIAFLHKRGPYVSNYSLKPEFRKSTSNGNIAEGAGTEANDEIGGAASTAADAEDVDNEDDDFEDV